MSSLWPRGTGQWNRTRIVVVSADERHRERLLRLWSEQHDVVAAATPLELIAHLEADGESISTVVLADLVGSADEAQLADFLDACYPWLRVIHAFEASQPRQARAYAQ
jgi:hypothetical protein